MVLGRRPRNARAPKHIVKPIKHYVLGHCTFVNALASFWTYSWATVSLHFFDIPSGWLGNKASTRPEVLRDRKFRCQHVLAQRYKGLKVYAYPFLGSPFPLY